LAKFSRDNLQEIKNYVQKLLKYALPYFVLVLLITLCACTLVRFFFDELEESTWKVLFILLMQTGIICYLGMITLLTKTLNYLNLEIALNIFRILLVWAICNLWKTDNMLTWYGVTVFALMIPEITISIFILNRLAHKQA
jgi:L-lactate permease